MIRYLFTNDLRITSLNDSIKNAAHLIEHDRVPSATVDKSANNNINTLAFYFNLRKGKNCTKVAVNGDIRKVVLNFIKKFQFPNTRTKESHSAAVEDGVCFAPMRAIIKLLYIAFINDGGTAFVTKEEISEFLFFNEAVAKNRTPDLVTVYKQIKEFRKTHALPDTIIPESEREWKHSDRQLREMCKVLKWAGCVSESEDGRFYVDHNSLTVQEKADMFSIMTYTDYWDSSEVDYETYMDLTDAEVDTNGEKEDPLNHNFYGMHITRRNSAVQQGEISIGWSGLGDLSTVDTKEQLANLMDEKFPEKKPRSKAQDVSQVWTFKGDMSVGDYVVFSDGKQAHIGVIKSDYYYEVDEEIRDIDYVNNRKVEWLKSIDRELLPKVFRSALASARSVFSLNAYKSIILELLDKEALDYDEEDIEEEIEEVESMEEQRPYIELNFTTNIDCEYERNRIVFGAPGTGKSFQMEEDRKTVLATLGGGYERVTFHPDYTYSSFVGCYKPVSEKGKIEYKYVPGPFMRVLVQALRSGLKDEVAKPYLIVIEEINRAKVAAVFGEVFQLLDRDENGTSDYEINASEDVKQYLSDELGGSLESFDKIRIPNNMFIWASMNSADQGVFPMDTAFKRRWSFEYKGIDENEDKVGGRIVLGQGEYELEVEWNDLRKAINDVLARTFKINEDKLMGPFFIGEEVFAFDKETGMIKNPEKFKKVFKSKVIMYLFEDAAKQHKHKLFSGCDATTYSAICNKFDEIGIDIFGADFRTTYFAK